MVTSLRGILSVGFGGEGVVVTYPVNLQFEIPLYNCIVRMSSKSVKLEAELLGKNISGVSFSV